MDYTTLGDTGTTVSRICLGCWSFGSEMEWMLDEDESHEIIEHARDLGINYFDTANAYSKGDSERILGEAIEGYDRDSLVLQTKVYNQMDLDNPNSGGLSRKTIEQELENSLDRLGVETIDIYMLHRWDDETPIDVTLRVLNDTVTRGQVRTTGVSSMWAYQLAEALYTAKSLGFEPPQVMQNHYNLTYREEEREVIPFCQKQDIAVTPYRPLASGFLAFPHEEYFSTHRGETDDSHIAQDLPYPKGGGKEINERVLELAEEKGVNMAQIAIAWQFHNDYVTAPTVGFETTEHIDQAVEALDIKLSDSDIAYMEEPYEPIPISGHA